MEKSACLKGGFGQRGVGGWLGRGGCKKVGGYRARFLPGSWVALLLAVIWHHFFWRRLRDPTATFIRSSRVSENNTEKKFPLFHVVQWKGLLICCHSHITFLTLNITPLPHTYLILHYYISHMLHYTLITCMYTMFRIHLIHSKSRKSPPLLLQLVSPLEQYLF